ncbi:GYD domain-containing protein [Halorussus gelatinilyticus]|uniref:GYD domain-containing protein n=1 Tax=Halorussus gelatinilyticus TaxID=2937524 RepID=A0A8U0IFU0_9EURY|nr:GYD domain-containing protein [Halorussus gelatinilyticus]UPV99081.1 GYD domain-containing protein [Halorussus gelatinilyticus]
MPEYASLVDVRTDFQNAQDLTSVWGDIRSDLEEQDADLKHTYAILGEYDFLVVMEAPDRDVAYQAGVALERHGLDAQTMEIIPTEELAQVVDDL